MGGVHVGSAVIVAQSLILGPRCTWLIWRETTDVRRIMRALDSMIGPDYNPDSAGKTDQVRSQLLVGNSALRAMVRTRTLGG